MEIFRRLELSEKIRDAGNPRTANQYAAYAGRVCGPFFTVLSGRNPVYQSVSECLKIIRECKDGSLPLEPMQRIPQMYLEPVLLDHARKDPNIDVRFGCRLMGFEQDAEGVTSFITDLKTGKNDHVRSEYLAGCDGPRSTVRNFLNIDYQGQRDLLGELFIIHIRSNELKGFFPNNEPYWHTWIAQPGLSGLLVSPCASKDDFVIHLPYPPTPDMDVRVLIDRLIGESLDYDIVQSGPWRPQFLVAKQLGRNRVFLAGDATHQYMPTGGLGMNTGITEAYDLSWKLAAVLSGWGGGKLTASYDAERRPVALRNRESARRCAAAVFEAQFNKTEKLMDQTHEGEAERKLLASDFEEKASRLYESLGIEIGYRYHGSPIIIEDEGEKPPYGFREYHPTSWPGARLPSFYLESGEALHDLLGRYFTLIVLSGDTNDVEPLKAAAQKAGLPLKVLPVAEPYIREVLRKKYILVRPDQHVCWRSDTMPEDCGRIIDVVRGAAS
jgi:2-polyprenyl-6-methoxyphenol hydroxylase-like FAD-dependent oxidoreductase